MDYSDPEDHVAFGPAAPWQASTASRPPRRGGSEPVVPKREKDRPTRSASVQAPRPTHRSFTSRSDDSRHRATPPPEDSLRHQRLETHSARASPRPYETVFFTPTAGYAAPSPRPSYARALPATPPDSTDEKSVDDTTSKSSASSPKQAVSVLPGTMAARNNKSKSSHRRRSGQQQKKKPTKPGWKVAFRSIFARRPVDETQFVKIEDKHWTDE